MASSSNSVKKTYEKGRLCCAIDCKNTAGRDVEFQFFRAKRADKEQSLAWAKAINREDENGSLWFPKDQDRICSAHFISGKPSTHKLSPDYRPTIFTTHKVHTMSESAQNRYQRVS